MSGIDALIDGAVVAGELDAGINPDIVAAKSSLGPGAIAVLAGKNVEREKKAKEPRWSREDDQFLCESLGVISEEEISRILGRTVVSIHLRWKRDLCLIAPIKQKHILTVNQLANGLGIDSHSAMKLFDLGILPGYKLPNDRKIKVVKRITVLRFICNPLNWMYFDPKRVNNSPLARNRGMKYYDTEFWSHARKLVLKKKSLWTDKWWRPGQVAKYHGLANSAAVNNAIRRGQLPATRWGNWWILKSNATDPALRFTQGKEKLEVTLKRWPEISAFIVLAEAVGLTCRQIGILMNWDLKRVGYLLCGLHKRRLILGIIKKHGLDIYYNKRTSKTAACWDKHRGRFPYLAKLIESPRLQKGLNRGERRALNQAMRRSDKYWEMRG
jgi:hypothetical protein